VRRWSGVTSLPIRVALSGGDTHRRARLAGLLEADGCEIAAAPHADACVLLDPDAAAVKALAEARPDAGVVVVTPDDRLPGDLRRLLRAGAAAILFDAQADACLAIAVHAVFAGQIVVPRALRSHVVRQPLSHREKEILRLVVRGWTNRQIADALFLAESTVKTHLSSAFAKLDAHSRAEVTQLILDPDEGRSLGILADGVDPAARVA
jgi:DNA-binding NarL/FixJ family response regulator